VALSDLSPAWLALLGVAVAGCLWFGLRSLIAGASGWRGLTESFHVDDLPQGERFRFASGSIGHGPMPVRYNKVLDVVVSPSGFGIAMVSVLGRAPAIFIPWAEVQSVATPRTMFVDTAVIRLCGQRPTISLHGAAGASVVHACAQSLPKRVPACHEPS